MRSTWRRATIIIVQDADLECDPAEIPAVVAPILAGQADVVYGSRFLVRRAARVQYFSHYLANTALTFFSNLLTNRNMTDIETCYKAFRAGVIKPLRLTSRGFGMEVEITAMVTKSRARIHEVPISYQSRSYEEGKKIGVSDGVMAGLYILYYNLVAPRLPKGRRYVAEVNSFLAAERYGHAPAVVATAGTARRVIGRSTMRLHARFSDDDLISILIFIVLAAFACMLPAQNDTFLHLRSGMQMWQTGSFLLTEPFSHTAYGAELHNHWWLTQLVFYGVHSLGGPFLLTHLCRSMRSGRRRRLMAAGPRTVGRSRRAAGVASHHNGAIVVDSPPSRQPGAAYDRSASRRAQPSVVAASCMRGLG